MPAALFTIISVYGDKRACTLKSRLVLLLNNSHISTLSEVKGKQTPNDMVFKLWTRLRDIARARPDEIATREIRGSA